MNTKTVLTALIALATIAAPIRGQDVAGSESSVGEVGPIAQLMRFYDGSPQVRARIAELRRNGYRPMDHNPLVRTLAKKVVAPYPGASFQVAVGEFLVWRRFQRIGRGDQRVVAARISDDVRRRPIYTIQLVPEGSLTPSDLTPDRGEEKFADDVQPSGPDENDIERDRDVPAPPPID